MKLGRSFEIGLQFQCHSESGILRLWTSSFCGQASQRTNFLIRLERFCSTRQKIRNPAIHAMLKFPTSRFLVTRNLFFFAAFTLAHAFQHHGILWKTAGRIRPSTHASRQCRIQMQNDAFDKIGRLGKQAKDWVEDAKGSSTFNVKGAGVGAVAGGLIAGPLGAILGGVVGKSVGLGKTAEREQAARLGLTPEIILQIQELESDVMASRADYEVGLDCGASFSKNAWKYPGVCAPFFQQLICPCSGCSGSPKWTSCEKSAANR
jgi:hypothetical protein